MRSNVVDFGASRCGIQDSFEAIQQAFLQGQHNTIGRSRVGGDLFFPSGIYRMKQGLRLPRVSGMNFVGCGWTDYNHGIYVGGGPRLADVTSLRASIITSDGLEKPIIESTGRALTFRDLSFWGIDKENKGKRRTLAAVACYKEKGVGSGGMRFENVGICDFIVGVDFGKEYEDGNCDTSVFDNVRFRDCGLGIRCNNTFSTGHSVRSVIFSDTVVGFAMDAGGKLNVDNVGLEGKNTEALLRTNRQGTGNGQFRFGCVWVDASVQKIPMMVVSTKEASYTAVFDHIHIPYGLKPNKDSLFRLYGGNRVIVRGGEYLTGFLGEFPDEEGGKEAAVLEIRDCILHNYEIATPDSTGKYFVRFRNCWTKSGESIPDQDFCNFKA